VSARRRFAWVAAHVAATFFANPQPLFGRVVDLGLLCAFLSPALLLLALRGLPPRRAALWAGLATWLAHSAVLHWIYVVTVVYGHAPPPVGVLAPLLLALYPALHGAAFGALAALAARPGALSPWLAAALWTALYDHARSFVLTGFPWATLGTAQHLNPALLPLAAFGGVYALSFVSALGGAGLAALVEGRRRAAAFAWAGVAAAHVAGLALGPGQTPEGAGSLRVAVLQGNIDQGVKWSDAWRDRTFEIYAELTREAVRRGARLVAWPETALPGALEVEPELAARVRALARETGAWLLVGGVGVEYDGGPRPSHYFDSAFSVDPEGQLRDRYDKTHLVPFGEYVPLRGLLGWFVSSVARGIAPMDVAEGPRPRALRVAPDGGEGLAVGVPVCFELIFPDLVRRFALDGAELLVGITNDAWYGRTGAPYQFLAITALRSAETGLWTARAANTGVSAFIDAAGRVREQTPIFERGLLVADVPRHPDPRAATFYVRHGDWLAWASWLAGALALGTERRRAARRAPRAPMRETPPPGEPRPAGGGE
jgi:apolipoprotein N-acyltransferase